MRSTLAAILLVTLTPLSNAAPRGDLAEPTARADGDWRIESARMRFSAFFQDGEGYQSQDGPVTGPGGEKLTVWQPNLEFTVRQDDHWRHDVAVSVDIVTAASPDAVDATSSSSRENEAASVEVTTHATPTAHDLWALRYGVHVEEHLYSGSVGVAYTRSVADDNASIGASLNAVVDRYKEFLPDGTKHGWTGRSGLNGNVSLTQILSRTTLGALTYGVTLQQGTLQQTWNSVPAESAADAPKPFARRRELLPDHRWRHAFDGEVAQHIPLTASTARAGYRFYFDDFGVLAHTGSFTLYQYFGPRFYLRAAYRYHHQTGIDFFTTLVRRDVDAGRYVAADSDLDAFGAHDVGLKALYYLHPLGRLSGGLDYVDVSYSRYVRTNGLHVDVGAAGYGRSF